MVILQDINLDTKTVSRDRLNIETKTRSNLFSWKGQFSPLLISVLLETYAKDKDAVLDPFMGSGTVMVEAGRHHLKCFGAEINPAAFLMAQTYGLINCPMQDRLNLLLRLGERLEKSFGSESLFSISDNPLGLENPKELIVSLWQSESDFYTRQLIEALIIMSDFYKEKFDKRSVLASWKRLANTVEQLPYSQEPVQLFLTDARNLPLPPASIDLVITSPPYINVFNYHQQYRASAEAMGWDLLHIAKSEMGSNRKNRGNRFYTVIQYCLDIAEMMSELRRVCKSTARIIMVVGRESTIRKTRLFNGDIVSRVGIRCQGLIAEKRQERAFVNRFGKTIYEDIIHFRVNATNESVNESPLIIAEEILRSAYEQAPLEAQKDIQDALNRSNKINSSPLFQMPEKRKFAQ